MKHHLFATKPGSKIDITGFDAAETPAAKGKEAAEEQPGATDRLL